MNIARRARLGLFTVVAAGTLAACNTGPSKEELEAVKNTFACQLAGERLVIRYDIGEARMLMPDGSRVTLYLVASTSGVRYTNGLMELRGRGTDMQLVREGASVQLVGCEQYTPPPK